MGFGWKDVLCIGARGVVLSDESFEIQRGKETALGVKIAFFRDDSLEQEE